MEKLLEKCFSKKNVQLATKNIHYGKRLGENIFNRFNSLFCKIKLAI